MSKKDECPLYGIPFVDDSDSKRDSGDLIYDIEISS